VAKAEKRRNAPSVIVSSGTNYITVVPCTLSANMTSLLQSISSGSSTSNASTSSSADAVEETLASLDQQSTITISDTEDEHDKWVALHSG
jgi:hypothetical protein